MVVKGTGGWVVSTFGALLVCTQASYSQIHSSEGQVDNKLSATELVVEYPSGFFTRYRPNTALDMVEQVPGFRPRDGSGDRGYGSAAGNILIDGRRPASKQDSPTDILNRIPASQVAHIELIRGPVRDIELLGEAEVINVILLDDIPASIRWELVAGANSQVDTVPLEAAVSLADLWRGVEFNTGFEVQRFARMDQGGWQIENGTGGTLEDRDEQEAEVGIEAGATLGATTWLGQTLLQINSQLEVERGDETSVSRRMSTDPEEGARNELFDEEADELQYELGLNAHHPLHEQLSGKLILLYNREHEEAGESQLSLDAEGNRTGLRVKQGEETGAEAITRVEFDWTGWSDHVVRLNLEFAWNMLANSEIEKEDKGAGLQVIDVPGANTRVEELRWDLQLKDNWTLGWFELDYGLGAEFSTINQSGDADLERDFVYLKPHLLVNRSLGRQKQLRLRLAREVGQLDFGDFVSASVFEDEDVILGNPDLRPERTWLADLAYEQRYGDIGMIGVALFHHWIDDVQDLLPLSATEEVPGNIGSGRRWGLRFEGTLPLDRIGLADARFDIDGRWQNSSVTDPVTGQRRVLSATSDDDEEGIAGADNEYMLNLAYRQDVNAHRLAWGVELEFTAENPRFKANELDINDEGAGLNAFIETTRWLDLKFRLEANNLLNQTETRERIFYIGARSLSDHVRRQYERTTEGRELLLSVSGSF